MERFGVASIITLVLLTACGRPTPGTPGAEIVVALRPPETATSFGSLMVEVFDREGEQLFFGPDGSVTASGEIARFDLAASGDALEIFLQDGVEYTFRAKAYDEPDGTWLAYDEVSATVTDALDLELDPHLLIGAVTFGPSAPASKVKPGQSLDLIAVVTAPDGRSLTPVTDYAVDFSLTGGEGELNAIDLGENARAVRATVDASIDSASFTVTATVSGWLADGDTARADGSVEAVFTVAVDDGPAGPADLVAPSLGVERVERFSTTTEVRVRGEAEDDTALDRIQLWDGATLIASSHLDERSEEGVAPIVFVDTRWSADLSFTTVPDLTAVAIDRAGNQTASTVEVFGTAADTFDPSDTHPYGHSSSATSVNRARQTLSLNGSYRSVAVRFTTGDDDLGLDTLYLALTKDSGDNGLEAVIAEDDGGTIGAALETLSFPGSIPSTSGTPIEFSASGETILTAGGSYWLLVRIPQGNEAELRWYYASASGSFAEARDTGTVLGDPSGSWSYSSSSNPLAFRLLGTPQPSPQ